MNENKSHGLLPIIAQAIEIMEAQKGHSLSTDELNLAELGRLTGLSRSKLRTLKRKGFITGDDTMLESAQHSPSAPGRFSQF